MQLDSYKVFFSGGVFYGINSAQQAANKQIQRNPGRNLKNRLERYHSKISS